MRGWWEQLGGRESACIHRLIGAELTNFPELGRFYFEEVISRSRRLISALLDRGVASGEFRPVANDYAIRGLPSLVIHAINTQRFFSTFDPDALDDTKVVDGILDLFFHGVLAVPATSTESR